VTRPELRLLRGGGFAYGQLPEVVAEVAALEVRYPGVRADLIALIGKAVATGITDERLVTYPVSRHREIGEIRLNIRDLLFRLYVTAPTPPPPDILGLLFALKDVGLEDVKSAQNDDIDHAAVRSARYMLQRATGR